MPKRILDEACQICGLVHKGPCDPKRLKKIDDGRLAHEEFRGPRQKSVAERIADGFEMLEEDDVIYPHEEN